MINGIGLALYVLPLPSLAVGVGDEELQPQFTAEVGRKSRLRASLEHDQVGRSDYRIGEATTFDTPTKKPSLVR